VIGAKRVAVESTFPIKIGTLSGAGRLNWNDQIEIDCELNNGGYLVAPVTVENSTHTTAIIRSRGKPNLRALTTDGLHLVHLNLSEILAAEVAKRGLDSSAIIRSGELCRGLFDQVSVAPRFAFKADPIEIIQGDSYSEADGTALQFHIANRGRGPRVLPFQAASCSWSSSAYPILNSLTPNDVDAVQVAERICLRLRASAEIAGDSHTAQQTQQNEPMTENAELVLGVLAKNRLKKLTQRKIDAQLKINRTPLGEHTIRQALAVLDKNGFSRRVGHQGNIVTDAGVAYLNKMIAAP
jgi:hypothetical protein